MRQIIKKNGAKITLRICTLESCRTCFNKYLRGAELHAMLGPRTALFAVIVGIYSGIPLCP